MTSRSANPVLTRREIVNETDMTLWNSDGSGGVVAFIIGAGIALV